MPKKPDDKPETEAEDALAEAKKDRGDPHARIDRLEELMRRNGWTVDG